MCAIKGKKIFFFWRFSKKFAHYAHQFTIFFGHLAHQSVRTGPQGFWPKFFFFFLVRRTFLRILAHKNCALRRILQPVVHFWKKNWICVSWRTKYVRGLVTKLVRQMPKKQKGVYGGVPVNTSFFICVLRRTVSCARCATFVRH